MAIFRAYLRSHAEGEQGRIDQSSMTRTGDPMLALTAYRALLGRADLIGQRWAAVLSRSDGNSSGKTIYFSRFDRPIGAGRIRPSAALDAWVTTDEGEALASGRRAEAIDWEADARPFSEVLRAWEESHGQEWKQAAERLGVEPETYRGWRSGRPCAQERALRRLMTLLG